MNQQGVSFEQKFHPVFKILALFAALALLVGAWHFANALARPVPQQADSASFVYLVKDINTKTALGYGGSAVVGDTVYFGTGIWKHDGNGIWKSDGSSSGTTRILDTYPPNNLTTSGNGFFYTVNDYDWHRQNLYYSDGTPGGTNMLKSWTEYDCYSPVEIIVDASTAFINCDMPDHPVLWASDGTVTGTVMIGTFYNLDINLALGDTLYFASSKTSAGNQLWKSDGTPGGTAIVKDIDPGSGNDAVGSLGEFNGTLYFGAYNGVDAYQLWKSDGTQAGTTLVKSFPSADYFTPPANLTAVNGTLFFSMQGATSSLWKSDGSEAGTVMLKEIAYIDYWGDFTSVNGMLFFRADDGVNGMELWKSDGSAAGTVLVKDIYPGSESSYPFQLTGWNDILFFTADDGVDGLELWKSDGTPGGTVLVKDINPGAGSTYIRNGGLVPFEGKLLFFADPGNGLGFWQSDGTPGGTTLVKLLTPTTRQSEPTNLYAFNGQAFFAADDGEHGFELWQSDGSAAGTAMVTDIYTGSESGLADQYYNLVSFDEVVSVGNTLFFVANDGVHGSELWKTDGTAGGTTLVKDITPGPQGEIYNNFTNFNGELFFAGQPIYGGLWKSDGTLAGTECIHVFTDTAGLASFLPIGDTLFFLNIAHQWDLWKTDGTITGTQLVKGGFAENYVISPNFTDLNGMLLFAVDDGIHGNELWKSDGTLTGTVMVKDIVPGPDSSDPDDFTNVNGVLYFDIGSSGSMSLWKSDGSEAGTVKIKDFEGIFYSRIAYQGKYYFVADDGVHGYELWQSDGSAAGTILVKDLNPAGDSSPRYFTEYDGMLYFSAIDEAGGWELWRSDGTPQGTERVADIYAGEKGSDPIYLVKTGGLLLFVADDGIHGAEVWALNSGAGLQPIFLPLLTR